MPEVSKLPQMPKINDFIYYLNFARIFITNAKAFTTVGSIMRSLLEKIQVSIIF